MYSIKTQNLYFSNEATKDATVFIQVQKWIHFFKQHKKSFIDNQPLFRQTLEIFLDCEQLCARLPANEADQFKSILKDDPVNSLSTIACALHEVSLMLQIATEDAAECNTSIDSTYNPYAAPQVHVYLSNVSTPVPLHMIRSSIVGKLITVRGAVIRVHSVKPLATSFTFVCTRCGVSIIRGCKDGRLDPPLLCTSNNCNGRHFAPQRRSATTVDWQKIRIQEEASESRRSWDEVNEVNGSSASTVRPVALTVDCEVKRSLVDRCVPGDIVCIVGIVKAAPTRGGSGSSASFMENNALPSAQSLYMLYVDGISISNVTKSAQSAIIGVDEGRLEPHATMPSHWWKDFEIEHIQRQSTRMLGDVIWETPIIDVEADKVENGHIFTEKSLDFIADIFQNVPHRFELVVASLCPAIIGKHAVKAGLVLALLGGNPIYSEDAKYLKRRGAIHCLLIGDPGLGKSRLLQSACNASDRGIYVCGSSSSSIGLTAFVTKDPVTGEHVLEAGALALADQGVCCIDELDKMSTLEKNSFLEAMEQQTVSVAKAGIVCSLSARASVISAANPKNGKYQECRTVSENVALPSPLLSRFDLIFILRDEPHGLTDSRMSSHLLKLRGSVNRKWKDKDVQDLLQNCDKPTSSLENRCAAAQEEDILPFPLLQTYIRYARSYCKPKLSEEAKELIKEFYLNLRKFDNAYSGGITITTRQLEALIRLSQARCRGDLLEIVTKEHVEDVIEIYKSTAVYNEDVSSLLDSSTKSYSKRSGKSVHALIPSFRKAIQRLAIDTENKIQKNELMLCAKNIITMSGNPTVKADDLVGILNNEGTLLCKGPHWEVIHFV